MEALNRDRCHSYLFSFVLLSVSVDNEEVEPAKRPCGLNLTKREAEREREGEKKQKLHFRDISTCVSHSHAQCCYTFGNFFNSFL